MSQDTVIHLGSQAMTSRSRSPGRCLLVAMLVGLAVSIFQAVTQIQEQSLTLIPKIGAIAVVSVVLGPWMLDQLVSYTVNLYTSIPTLVGT